MYVVVVFMVIQGVRRLYESYFVVRMGKFFMWCVYWVLGLVYYIVIGFSVWVEGLGMLIEFEQGYEVVL